jgi:hypothetical protein
MSPGLGDNSGFPLKISGCTDSLAEKEGFEPSVPVAGTLGIFGVNGYSEGTAEPFSPPGLLRLECPLSGHSELLQHDPT